MNKANLYTETFQQRWVRTRTLRLSQLGTAGERTGPISSGHKRTSQLGHTVNYGLMLPQPLWLPFQIFPTGSHFFRIPRRLGSHLRFPPPNGGPERPDPSAPTADGAGARRAAWSGAEGGSKILPVVPQLIIPIKKASLRRVSFRGPVVARDGWGGVHPKT